MPLDLILLQFLGLRPRDHLIDKIVRHIITIKYCTYLCAYCLDNLKTIILAPWAILPLHDLVFTTKYIDNM